MRWTRHDSKLVTSDQPQQCSCQLTSDPNSMRLLNPSIPSKMSLRDCCSFEPVLSSTHVAVLGDSKAQRQERQPLPRERQKPNRGDTAHSRQAQPETHQASKSKQERRAAAWRQLRIWLPQDNLNPLEPSSATICQQKPHRWILVTI